MSKRASPIPEYERQVSSIGGPALDNRGYLSALQITARAQQAFNAGFDDLEKFADALNKTANERKAMEAETAISAAMRSRRLEVLGGLTPDKADGLLDRETAALAEMRDSMKQNISMNPDLWDKLFNREAEQHLDKIGVVELQQRAVADTQARHALLNTKLDALADIPVGDMSALELYMKDVDELLPGRGDEAEKFKDKAVEQQFKLWSRIDPQGTLDWFKDNKGSIAKRFGASSSKMIDILDSTESKLQAQKNLQIALDNRNEMLRKRAQEKYDNDIGNKYLTDMMAGGERAATALRDIQDDSKLSFERRSALLHWGQNVGGKAVDAMTQSYTMRWHDVASTRAWTQADETAFQKDVLEGKVDEAGFMKVRTQIEQTQKAWNSAKGPAMETMAKYIRNAIAPAKAIGMPTDQHAENKALKLIQAASLYAKDRTPEQLMKDFDINDAGSWLNRLVSTNQDNKVGKAALSQPVLLEWTPVLPGQGSVTSLAPGDMRQEGESIADWKKRTGK